MVSLPNYNSIDEQINTRYNITHRVIYFNELIPIITL